MDIVNYLTGITANITNETAPKSIPATIVGGAFTDLANLTKTNVEAVNATTTGNTSSIVSLSATTANLNTTVLLLSGITSGHTIAISALSGVTSGFTSSVSAISAATIANNLAVSTLSASTTGYTASISSLSATTTGNTLALNTFSNTINTTVGVPNLVNYPLDFSVLTSQGGGGNLYTNNDGLVNLRGYLNSVRIETVSGATVTPYVFSLSAGSINIIYTYASFRTTATTHTQIITDSYIVEAGLYVGFKSTGLVNYLATANYGYQSGHTGFVGFKFAFDFVINTNTSTGILQRLATDEALITSITTGNTILTNYVAMPNVVSYPIDFSTLTSVGGANTPYSNGEVITNAGRLSSLRIEALTGSTVTISVYNLNITSAITGTLLYTFAPFVTTASTQTQTITDGYIIPAGAYIFVQSSLSTNYVGASNWGYKITGGVFSTAGVKTAHDFVITTDPTSGLTYNVNTLANNITAQQAQINALGNVILKPVNLFRSIFTSLSGFTSTGWTVSNNTAIPSGTGSTNGLWYDHRYNCNPRSMSIDVVLQGDSVFYFDTAPVGYQQGDGVFAVDAVQNMLFIYNRNNTTQALTQVASGVIPFTIVSGRKYTFTLNIDNWLSKFFIKDTITAQSFELDYQISTTGLGTENRQQDSYKFYLQSGSISGISVSNFTVTSKYKPTVWLGGDSITEGVYFTSQNYLTRYAYLLFLKLKGSCVISARGGASIGDINDKVITELPYIKPDYAMLTIGTNGGLSVSGLTTTVNNILALGVTPILNHVPNRGDGSHISTNQTIDTVCNSVAGVIRGCLFDIATSINNDPTQSYIVSAYQSDGVHPNSAGDALMAARFDIDVPFLFV